MSKRLMFLRTVGKSTTQSSAPKQTLHSENTSTHKLEWKEYLVQLRPQIHKNKIIIIRMTRYDGRNMKQKWMVVVKCHADESGADHRKFETKNVTTRLIRTQGLGQLSLPSLHEDLLRLGRRQMQVGFFPSLAKCMRSW